jgi:hypothetical protein
MLNRLRWIAGILIALPFQLLPGPVAGEGIEGLPAIRAEQRFLASSESPNEAEAARGEALKALPAKGGYTVIPLPAFSYDRNESYWVGGLVPILKSNPKEEVEDIFVPQYLHNRFVRETFTLNYYGYRADESIQYRAIASYSSNVERNFEVAYKNTAVAGGRYILAAEGAWFKNGFSRFFGIGNDTPEHNETNYTLRSTRVNLTGGINLGQNTSVLFTERYTDVRVDTGVVDTLPQIRSLFPGISGIGGAQIFAHRLTVLYDTRDNAMTPSKGRYVAAYAELNQNVIHKASDRWGHFSLDARQLIPHGSDRMVFVGRFLIEGVTGQGIPFYERPMLGGENTLRGFGTSRYIDDLAVLLNFEERIRVMRRRIFDNPIELEIAPFLDIGRVTDNFQTDGLKRIQYNPGIGFRLLARPNVAARVDVAYGRDGGNVFVGLNYPF